MADPDPHWVQVWDLPPRPRAGDKIGARALLQAVKRAGEGGTGTFGLRLMQGDLDSMLSVIELACGPRKTHAEPLQAAFGKLRLIHLRRRDRVAQAISLVKAEQTGLWHAAPDGREIERLSPPADPQYDFDLLRERVAGIEASDAAWEGWFEREGLDPLRLEYETMSANPGRTVRTICRQLAIPLRQSPAPTPRTARLADGLSAAWSKRFRDDLARFDACQR